MISLHGRTKHELANFGRITRKNAEISRYFCTEVSLVLIQYLRFPDNRKNVFPFRIKHGEIVKKMENFSAGLGKLQFHVITKTISEILRNFCCFSLRFDFLQAP